MDIKFNFHSEWPSIQVAKVIEKPHTRGSSGPISHYSRKIEHGFDYPPLAIGFGDKDNEFDSMRAFDVDDTYVYVPQTYNNTRMYRCLVIYTLDITKDYNYGKIDSAVGEVPSHSVSDSLDLRKFLLHSRAVSPMVYSVVTKDFKNTGDKLEYTHDLGYPIFNFGYVRLDMTGGIYMKGIWMNAPLAGQGFPWTTTDGITSTVNAGDSQGIIANKGSIITLRNPAIISSNEMEVTL